MSLIQYRVRCLMELNSFEECSQQLNTIKEKQVDLENFFLEIIAFLCKNSFALILGLRYITFIGKIGIPTRQS